MRRRVILTGGLAFCAKASIAARALTDKTTVDNDDASKILTDTMGAYRNVRNFREIVLGVDHRILGTTASVRQDLLFVDANHYFVALTCTYAGTVTQDQYLAFDGGVLHWSSLDGVVVRTSDPNIEGSLLGASIGAYGFSGAWTLKLLRARATGERTVYGFVTDVERLSDAQDENGRYFVLQCMHAKDDIKTMWINKETHMIAKVSVHYARLASELQFRQVTLTRTDALPTALPLRPSLPAK